MLPILQPEEINQPKGSLIVEILEEQEEILGSNNEVDFGALIQAKLGDIFPVVKQDHDWTTLPYATPSQRNNIFDPDTCATNGHQDCIQDLHLQQFNAVLPEPSVRYTAIKSHTIPNVGNSFANVFNSIVNDGMVKEVDCPSIADTTTQAQFYANLDVSLDQKEYFKKNFDVMRMAIPRRTDNPHAMTLQNINNGLLYSEVIVAVDGRYTFNNLGEIVRSQSNDSHTVRIARLAIPSQNFHLIKDSENPAGFVKFEPNYEFHDGYILFLKKKVMFELVKEPGLPAVYLHVIASDHYYGIASSDEVPGGDLLKTFSGTYGNANINHLTIPFDHSKIVGEIKAGLFSK